MDDVFGEVRVDDDRRHEPLQSNGMVLIGRGAEASVPLHGVSRHRLNEPRRGRFAS
ncbi:hypothetical protein [Curtobacterium sp. A7_M15]|uniref:hypothetical protein n=1 Tax=Curtobacterium sp. A7_M15 TaxID=3065241 RepID=UPI002737C413|nr:hypothetical protein [Curtobacterium sp. A7_M15]